MQGNELRYQINSINELAQMLIERLEEIESFELSKHSLRFVESVMRRDVIMLNDFVKIIRRYDSKTQNEKERIIELIKLLDVKI